MDKMRTERIDMHVGLVTRSQIDYALDLANELDAKGNSIFLYLDYSHTVQEVKCPDQPVRQLYENGLLPATCRINLLNLPRMRDLRSFIFFRGLVRKLHNDGIDVVHILLNPGEIWLALLACFLNGIPVITTLIVPTANKGERLPGFLIWVINKLATLGSSLVIVNGSDQVELVNRLYKLPTSRIAYIPLNLHARAIKLNYRSVAEEPGTILFFGRAHPHKGLEYLVRAQPLITRQVPYARILISAHGEDLKHCQQIIQDHSKFEIKEGYVSGDMMAHYFQRSSLVVLPYLSASTSGILVTAYSFAKPVVASRVGCLAEYLENGVTGLLVPPANVEELANAVIHLLLDNDLRHRMGMNARNWILRQQKTIADQTLRVYENAIAMYSRENHLIQKRNAS